MPLLSQSPEHASSRSLPPVASLELWANSAMDRLVLAEIILKAATQSAMVKSSMSKAEDVSSLHQRLNSNAIAVPRPQVDFPSVVTAQAHSMLARLQTANKYLHHHCFGTDQVCADSVDGKRALHLVFICSDSCFYFQGLRNHFSDKCSTNATCTVLLRWCLSQRRSGDLIQHRSWIGSCSFNRHRDAIQDCRPNRLAILPSAIHCHRHTA